MNCSLLKSCVLQGHNLGLHHAADDRGKECAMDKWAMVLMSGRLLLDKRSSRGTLLVSLVERMSWPGPLFELTGH